ncbi:Nucleic-acid-binding protein from transposon X-element [Eumeta japonica]|uniref:Nucleic-acid-binding protein from transposon X-element n=1 Tax=Eumeta variegata TaxID=151549 RepID=A0A4C1Y7T4_EUMVA|nr:Nucleic-acid-binding protein from transposon X-element [Eumeta japonica]
MTSRARKQASNSRSSSMTPPYTCAIVTFVKLLLASRRPSTHWFQTWRIEVNPEKLAAIFFNYSKTKKKEIVPYNSPTFRIYHIKRVRQNAQLYLSRLTGMIGKKSKMSLINKCTLYIMCIRPVMTYATPVSAHADLKALYQLQNLQNSFCKRASGALWGFLVRASQSVHTPRTRVRDSSLGFLSPSPARRKLKKKGFRCSSEFCFVGTWPYSHDLSQHKRPRGHRLITRARPTVGRHARQRFRDPSWLVATARVGSGHSRLRALSFLVQQGYEVPAEIENALDLAVSRVNSRDSSLCLSACSSGKRSASAISSDDDLGANKLVNTIIGSDKEAADSFKIVKRKSRKVSRWLRKTSTRSLTKTTIVAPKQSTVGVKNSSANGLKPSPPPKVKVSPLICLRYKYKWNLVTTECTRLHINYTRAQNTNQGIKISTGTIEDFRKLNAFFVKSNIPFYTFTLEEEKPKVKAVIKGIPLELEIPDIKADLISQGYPVHAVHRMHHRNGSALAMVLVVLERNDQAKEIFKNLCRVCSLSGVIVEAPYKRSMSSQCHRCQLYGNTAANFVAQPRCVKCLVPHWTKDCGRTKESGGKRSCCNCGQEHTANYGGCSAAPKPKPLKFKTINRANLPIIKHLNGNQFPPLAQPNCPATRADSKHPLETAGGWISRPAPQAVKQWKKPLPWVNQQSLHETNVRESSKQPSRSHGTAAFTLGEDINTIMSILQAKYLGYRPKKGVALKLSSIKPLQCLNLDHRPVLMRLGSLSGDCPPAVKTITNWQKVSTVLQEIDTLILNSIPNDIVSIDDIYIEIGGLINHISCLETSKN